MTILLLSTPSLAAIVSTHDFSGFPKYSGTTPVDAVTAAAIEPLSGILPSSVGQFRSGWVDMYRAPREKNYH